MDQRESHQHCIHTCYRTSYKKQHISTQDEKVIHPTRKTTRQAACTNNTESITMYIKQIILSFAFSTLFLWNLSVAAPPRMLFQGKPTHDATEPGGSRTRFAMMRLPDGSFAFYNRYQPQQGPLKLPDITGKQYTFLPHLPKKISQSKLILESKVLVNTQVVLSRDGKVKSVYVKNESIDPVNVKKVGLRRYLNVWIKQADTKKTFKPSMIWRGYNGSQMEYQELPSGRLLVPYGSFQPHASATPPTGRHKTIIQYSDDGGTTWHESKSQLISPCYTGFNGSNEGACEPAFEQLADGRLWMLMRTQTGFLYESFSKDDGTTWQKATPSRFNTSTGPPNIMRHKNGWLVVCWNNCEMPPRQQGNGVYGGRDALHIAVSADEGKTWRGFREIYLDHRRNGNPEKSGDRGTAYPLGGYTTDGNIVVIAGQGKGGRNPIIVDPKWIVETTASTDFSDGLTQWSVYKHYGPAKRWWRARAVGCKLITNPTDATSRCLHIRKPDDLPADGAVWNFPNGWKGKLTAKVMFKKGFQGGMISLCDRMFDPVNDNGEKFSVFQLSLQEDGKVGNVQLQSEKWYDISLQWDLSKSTCQILVNGKDAGQLKLNNKTLNGISYVRLRSATKKIDQAGFLVDRVQVIIDDPYAPACSPQDQQQQEARYIKKMVPLWKKSE